MEFFVLSLWIMMGDGSTDVRPIKAAPPQATMIECNRLRLREEFIKIKIDALRVNIVEDAKLVCVRVPRASA